MATLLKKYPDTNVGEAERWISMLAGTGLLAYGLTRKDPAGLGLAAIGGSLAWRGASGHCGFYQAFGINTVERGYEKGTGSNAGVPYELGIRVEHEIRIQRSPAELYRFWRNFENLPKFMDHLDCVQVRDDRVSHWVVRGPAGYKVEWDAEIISETEDKLIGWRSLPGSQVDNGGSVHFESSANGATIVRVQLQYNPPAGSVGAWVARMFGEDPKEMIREDMDRLRELMETGTITTRSSGSSKRSEVSSENRWSDRKRGVWNRDNVENASEESFPASDAPSWTPETV